jgi:predicted RNase H-like nuclease
MPIVAGIDGCPSGWLCLVKDMTTGKVVAHILPKIDELLNLCPRPDVVMVDVPIGLPDAGSRSCDQVARSHLKAPRASSVFPTPIRAVLDAVNYSQACQIGMQTDGRKLSRQTWAILPKIREVDQFFRADVSRQQWVREVHPEVSFWAWNGNKAMVNRKKAQAGRMEREALINPKYGEACRDAQTLLPRGKYGQDDLLDAFAALWTAERFVNGTALSLPASPPVDSHGLRMEMIV